MATPASAYPRLSDDGLSLVAGDRVLVKDRTTEIGSGIGGQFGANGWIYFGGHDGVFRRWRYGVIEVVRQQGFNAFAVAGTRWLGWRPDTGLVWHNEVVWAGWHSPALSETRWAAILDTPGGKWLFAGRGDGQDGEIVAFNARDPVLRGDLLTWVVDDASGSSVWGQQGHDGPIERLSLPGNTRQGYIVPVEIDGERWALSHDHLRAMLYPWGEHEGYVVAFAPAHRPDGRQLPDGHVRVVYDAEHDVLGEYVVDVRTVPRVDLRTSVEPVIDRTSTVDVLDYLPIGVALEGSHLLAGRYTGQQPNVFSIAKHPDGGGEWSAHDDQWIYHHLDQASSSIGEVASGRFVPRFDDKGNRIDAYYIADDARILPRRVKTGDVTVVDARIYRLADGHSDPWHHENRVELFSSFPTPMGSGRALRWTYDNRTARDPNGRLKGRFEKFIYAIVNGRRYSRWEDWRTKDDNSGDELMQQTEFQQVDVAPAVTWRLSPRPKDAPLLPSEDDMNAPGVQIDRYGPVIGPTGTWSVEWHDRNNPGVSGKVEIVNGSVHVAMTNPEGSDRSGNRRPVEVRG